ncbi:hypothetical protein P170DRAFT_109811 [Aspergillus steynii IBT 23096]|uniref:Uncharacterized protein n=1 Tax=Aspergillus steynii IBT 23096 TaxID=1392250 RepID=A0A2I2GIG8_9EURO|nr:uncharacterized protein P170DRAFT_109811 [Aspergillus steynii IBT 23096]PLB52672.1 hypothetical protein P170DRAFT_109811 [Aspergillus steynii IBT 23096]
MRASTQPDAAREKSNANRLQDRHRPWAAITSWTGRVTRSHARDVPNSPSQSSLEEFVEEMMKHDKSRRNLAGAHQSLVRMVIIVIIAIISGVEYGGKSDGQDVDANQAGGVGSWTNHGVEPGQLTVHTTPISVFFHGPSLGQIGAQEWSSVSSQNSERTMMNQLGDAMALKETKSPVAGIPVATTR